MVPPNQDKEVFNRISPGATPIQPEKLLAEPTTPKLPPNGMPVPAAPSPPNPKPTPRLRRPRRDAGNAGRRRGQAGATPPPASDASRAASPPPPTCRPPAAESGPSIANLIEDFRPYRRLARAGASVKNEDVARIDVGAPASAAWRSRWPICACRRCASISATKACGIASRPGPLDEKQAQNVCALLKGRKADCVTVPPRDDIEPVMSRPRAAIFGCAGLILTADERAFFREADPLGFILFARNVDTPDQVRPRRACACGGAAPTRRC